MAYTPPTLEQFIARFPIFQDSDPVQVQALLNEAKRGADESWVEQDYAPAIMYLAAHLLTLDSSQEGDALGIGPGGGGAIASEGLGGLSVSYFNPNSGGATPSAYADTEYGRRYLALLKLNRGGPLVI